MHGHLPSSVLTFQSHLFWLRDGDMGSKFTEDTNDGGPLSRLPTLLAKRLANVDQKGGTPHGEVMLTT